MVVRLCPPVVAFLLGLACSGPAPPAVALVAAERDFAELVARAEQVVEGTVTEVREEPDASGVQRTLVVLVDLVVLKGQVGGDRFTLDLAGGSKQGRRAAILDLPEFRPGERYVLFVAGNGRAVCPLVGVWQGAFRVVRDQQRGVDVVVTYGGEPVTGKHGRRLLRRSSDRESGPALTVQEFRNLVSEEIARPSP